MIKEIKPAVRMFALVKGKPKGFDVFPSTQDAMRYEAGARGIEGFILYQGKITKVRSSFTSRPKPRWVGNWTHVFQTRADDGTVCTHGYHAPQPKRHILARAIVAKARDALRDAKRSAVRNIREAQSNLRKARKEAKAKAK